MTLCLYNNLGNGKYENIFAWVPDEPQWWITGFNPEKTEPDYTKMVLVGSIDFSTNTEMYQDLKLSYISGDNVDNIFFDDNNHTVWIIW